MTTPAQTEPKLAPALAQAMRGWAGVLSLWRICNNGKCRRARCCRGKPRDCWRMNYPLLPDGVQGWFDAIAEAQENNVPVDTAFARIENSDEGVAFEFWCRAVDHSLRSAPSRA